MNDVQWLSTMKGQLKMKIVRSMTATYFYSDSTSITTLVICFLTNSFWSTVSVLSLYLFKTNIFCQEGDNVYIYTRIYFRVDTPLSWLHFIKIFPLLIAKLFYIFDFFSAPTIMHISTQLFYLLLSVYLSFASLLGNVPLLDHLSSFIFL